jgi:chemotaxis protein MotB
MPPRGVILVIAWLLPWAVGCGRVVFTPNTQQQAMTLTPPQQEALAQQTQQIQARAAALDRDNQELEALLAQSRQQLQLMRDQVVATQDQLRATTSQLATAQQDNATLKDRTQALTASSQQRAVAEIRANNTLLRPLSLSNLPGVEVRQDGDTIRVTIPGDQLFTSGTAQLQPSAQQLLTTVAQDLLTNYPQQLIGIEGHTDSGQLLSPQFPSSHHLAVAQATAVYDVLRRSVNAAPQQFFLIAHGANHPLVSNATPAGQVKNRRIELVVYPETVRAR